MACSSSFWYYGLVLVCICFESLNSTPVQSALPSVNQHSKRQSYTCWGRLQTVPGPYSQCYCGVQINSVRTECCDGVSCRTIYSSVQRRSCVQNCPAGLQSGIAGSISSVGSTYQIQCSCPAYTYADQSYKGCCKELPCPGYSYTFRTSRASGTIQFPDRVPGNCRQFKGELKIVAPSDRCISVTADARSLQLKTGEMVEVHDGDGCLLWRGRSLRGVTSLSSGSTIKIVFMTPDITLTNGLYIQFRLQRVCSVGACPSTSLPTTLPPTILSLTTLPLPTPTPVEPLTVTYTLRTSKRFGIVHFPGITSTYHVRFKGFLVIKAAKDNCIIKVTADLKSNDTRTGELVKVYNGRIQDRLLYSGSSLQGTAVLSGPTMTIVFESPDISLSNGLHVHYDLQNCTDEELVTTQPPTRTTTTDRLSVHNINTTPTDGIGSGGCSDPCPKPRPGCQLVPQYDGDCCGQEQCGECCDLENEDVDELYVTLPDWNKEDSSVETVYHVMFDTVQASPLSNAYGRSKRQTYTCGPPRHVVTEEVQHSPCYCGFQTITVSINCCELKQCYTILSGSDQRSCLPNCSSGQLNPVLQSVEGVESEQQMQCACPNNYTLDNETGCCKDITALLDLCSTMKCKPHQHCVHYTGHSLDTHMAYCNDTCEGFMGCKDHEECYVIQSGFCYRGPDLDRHCPYVAGCKLKLNKPGKCPEPKSGQCSNQMHECSIDTQCVGNNKCCWDGCSRICVTPVDDPCEDVQCKPYQECNVSANGAAYCLDTCKNNGPCPNNTVCRLANQCCTDGVLCPDIAICEKPCKKYKRTLETYTKRGIVYFPDQDYSSESCTRFEGVLNIVATNGLCISVTAKRQTKPGETVEIYDGYSSNCLVFQGESLHGVNIVSEGPVLTIIFKSPDISQSNGLDVHYKLQRICVFEECPKVLPTTSLPTTCVSPPTTGGENCTDPCPQPHKGCTLIKVWPGDCCGQEQCVVNPRT